MSTLMESTAQEIALFVFIPFCKIKCTYCDFNAYANMARVMEPYAEAVAREIRGAAPRLGVKARAKSVYFGGGTPSLVPAAHIEEILRACRDLISLDPNAEITLEANPGTVNLDKLRAFRSLGINRLSLGVQSFDDATVRRLNRGHTVRDALETYDLARRAGFDNLNLDFIYGLPLQTLAQWRDTLERALALAPEHLSLYALKVEEGTGLEHQIARGKYPRPDDYLSADMYMLAEELLASSGYDHYEISNWARPGLGSRHNLTYWHNEPYLGFGAGAHSFFQRARYWNVMSPVEYIGRIERGEGVVDGSEEIGRELEMAETMILGLRLGEGVSFEGFENRFGEDGYAKYGETLRQVRELGLVELDDRGVRLTPRGRLLSNEVFWRLLPD
ncbi:MAG: radical SAM family heme chaperone HemW [Acidobacteriota bacterium]